jgi:glycosyltransferase involved in cell wall biosynthesis
MAFSPLISIVMPSFQQASFLEEAVRSVLDQQGVEVELVVMDPGSTDGSRELLLTLKEEYGKRLVLHFAPDKGQSDAINRGMALARGNILAWLNSMTTLAGSARRGGFIPGYYDRWLYGCGIINEQGAPILRGVAWYKNIRGRRFSIFKLLTEDFIPQMAAFWNRSIWDKVGGVDNNRHLDMDYDLFLRFSRVVRPAVLAAYLADFRVQRHAKSSVRTFEAIDEAFRTAQEHATGLGWRGKFAIMLHRIYRMRTKLIYKFVK